MVCPKCGSTEISIQSFQEQTESKTDVKIKSKYKEKRHGFLWWVFIGSWWWIIDLFLWVFVFPFRFLFSLFRKRKYVGTSTEKSTTKNSFNYVNLCTCQNCGKTWKTTAR